MNRPEHRHSIFDWGSSVIYRTNLRSVELLDRIWWFVRMRWVAGSICILIWPILEWYEMGLEIKAICFLQAGLGLMIMNLIYVWIGRILLAKTQPENAQKIRMFLRVQIVWDFLILSYLTYHTGSVETPMVLLYIPHIILSTLFFKRIKSLLIACLAWFFAVAPLLLEVFDLVPVVKVFPGSLKHHVLLTQYPVAILLVVAIGATYLAIWYIISEIITSLKLREGQLEEAHEMLKKLDVEKTHATLMATHELKAPFAAIKSYVYTLRDGYCGELPEKAFKVIERIGERCDRLMEKITDIIHLSNIKTLVVSEINFVPTPLIPILEEEVIESDLVGRKRNITVQLHAPTAPVLINGSRLHLKTLFSNLIRNAVAYSFDGGEVRVSLDRVEEKVIVRIEDHGIGIPKELFEKIFEEHFRSNEAVAHNPNGTGLGLPMVKELVKLHGGILSLHSQVGHGTTFELTFSNTEVESKEG